MPSHNSGFPQGFDGHRKEQATMGLRLTPAQRLRWLEETMTTLRRWQGRARAAAPVPTSSGTTGHVGTDSAEVKATVVVGPGKGKS